MIPASEGKRPDLLVRIEKSLPGWSHMYIDKLVSQLTLPSSKPCWNINSKCLWVEDNKLLCVCFLCISYRPADLEVTKSKDRRNWKITRWHKVYWKFKILSFLLGTEIGDAWSKLILYPKILCIMKMKAIISGMWITIY